DHRRNMLDKDVTEFGVGIAHSASSDKYYAVQMFGRPRSDSIAFEVSNRSGDTVQFTVDGKPVTLGPRYTGTYSSCRPPDLVLPAAKGEAVHPHNGARYAIEKDADGRYRISEK